MNRADTQERILAAGWRCDVCEYPLDGLPDRAEETQCPECGYTGRPVGAPAVPRTAAMALAAIVSGLSVLVAGFAGMIGYAASQADTSSVERMTGGLLGLGFVAGVLYVAAVVWAVPFARWRIARFIAALIPVAVGAFAAYWMLRLGSLFEAPFFAWSVLAFSYLLYPEMNNCLRGRLPWSANR